MVAYTSIDSWCVEMRELLSAVPPGWHIIACDDSLYVIADSAFAEYDYCVSDAVRAGRPIDLGRITDCGGT